jgi:hypothetical protein
VREASLEPIGISPITEMVPAPGFASLRTGASSGPWFFQTLAEIDRRKLMKQAVGRSVAPNIHEGRALTLKVLKVRRMLDRKGHRISAVPRQRPSLAD